MVTAAGDGRPRPACADLLEGMAAAGVRRALWVLRPGKWDIPALLGDGAAYRLSLGYLIMGAPYGAPFTLDQAYPFVRGARVALGFPDILFAPHDALARLLDHQEATGADLALGLVTTDRPDKADLVDCDDTGRVRAITIKPGRSELRNTWILAVWGPAFTELLHTRVRAELSAVPPGGTPSRELYISDLILDALAAGMRVETVFFPEGRYRDIGTPDDLVRVVREGL